MDRARDAVGLWRRALALHAADRWAYVPSDVVEHSLSALTDALRESGVSQRHLPDSAAWRRIAESLVEEPESALAIAISSGLGDAAQILNALTGRTPRGTDRFPFLGGPKVGPMWLRMMVFPGGAHIGGVEVIPVAVDSQVRRVTENLGVADTVGVALKDARQTIQDAWAARVRTEGAEGPNSLAGTCAALDPALWYFGRVGCSYCEALGHRVPIAPICSDCRLAEAPSATHPLVTPSRGSAADVKPLIGLVGCLKTKLPYAAAARDLYISPLFIGRREAVESRAAKWFVLSAEYGLVRPDEVIEPYDRELARIPASDRRAWARGVVDKLRRELGELSSYRFEVHAGRAYFGFGLVRSLRASGAEVSLPAEGLTQGRQRQFYGRGGRSDAAGNPADGRRSNSRYQPIAAILENSRETGVTLNFVEMETAIGGPLPRSARDYQAWWYGTASYPQPWITAGWRPRPRLRQGLVEFVRDPRPTGSGEQTGTDPS